MTPTEVWRDYLPKGTRLPVWSPPPRMRPALEALPAELHPILRDPVLFLQAFVSWKGRALKLDGWQVSFLRSRHRFRAMTKARQIGASWVAACEAFHRAFVYEDDETSFVSISENEAKNKVLYVARLLDGLEPWLGAMVKVPVHSREEIWFGSEGRPSIIRSLPASSSLRGRTTHVVMDETDHMRPGQDTETFTAAIGCVTRGLRLTVFSSPFGEETVLAMITKPSAKGEKNEYPDFLKVELPWWVSRNESVLETVSLARRNMPPEDFEQEYECSRSSVQDSLFPQDFIRAHWHDRRVIAGTELAAEGQYVAGFDPGGSGHPAVFTAFKFENGQWDQLVLEPWRGKSLTWQQAYLEKALHKCQGMTLAIDPGGLGKQMADYLADEFGSRCVPINFTQQSKHDMALGFRRMLETGEARIAHDIDLYNQMNKTRRKPGGRLEQPTTSKKSHFDEFWATALALDVAAGDSVSIYESRGMRSLDTSGDDDSVSEAELIAEMWADQDAKDKRRLGLLNNEPVDA